MEWFMHELHFFPFICHSHMYACIKTRWFRTAKECDHFSACHWNCVKFSFLPHLSNRNRLVIINGLQISGDFSNWAWTHSHFAHWWCIPFEWFALNHTIERYLNRQVLALTALGLVMCIVHHLQLKSQMYNEQTNL